MYKKVTFEKLDGGTCSFICRTDVLLFSYGIDLPDLTQKEVHDLSELFKEHGLKYKIEGDDKGYTIIVYIESYKDISIFKAPYEDMTREQLIETLIQRDEEKRVLSLNLENIKTSFSELYLKLIQ